MANTGGGLSLKRFFNTTWQRENSLRIDINYMMTDYIGEKEGISPNEIAELAPLTTATREALDKKRGEMAWRDLPYTQEESVKSILAYVESVKGKFENFVIIGIGGSALGPIAIHQALNHQYYNELPSEKRKGYPRFYVMDNVDPEKFTALLDIIDPAKTLFNVITKSGSTSETMAQFMIVRTLLKAKLGGKYKEHLVATTDDTKGNLVAIAKEEGYKLFYVPEGVGGRFSQLSPVGLLPAAITGIDIEELLAGAAFMDNWIVENPGQNPAYLRAILHYLSMLKGKNISVMMPYAECLKYVADWYAQLWAESLGKRFNCHGKEVFTGQTPVRALGVTDQHSQVQLYTEGPFDKVINFLAVGEFRSSVLIPESFAALPNVSFLGGKTLEQLMEAERQATEFALLKAKRPNNTILLPQVNEFTLGQLLYMLEVETAFMGELLTINAFDQPGVEEGKNATYALMGRPGFEQKKSEIENSTSKRADFVLSRRG